MILVTPKQEVEKKLMGLRVNFFISNFQVEWESDVWTKIWFRGSVFVQMRRFDFDFYFFPFLW